MHMSLDPRLLRARWLALAASLIMLAVAATAVLVSHASRLGLAARVNGEPITGRELQRALADPSVQRQAQQQRDLQRLLPVKHAGEAQAKAGPPDAKELEGVALKKLVYRRLLAQEAARRGIGVSANELDAAVTALKRRFKDEAGYQAWRKAQDIADASLLDMLRTELLVARVSAALVQGARPSAEQVQDYYEKHKTELKTSEAVRLQVIAVKDKAAAEGILSAVKKGADFGALAEERSRGSRAGEGAYVGWVSPETLPPTQRSALGTLKVGETRGPLQTGSEFLVVKLLERRPAALKGFAEAQAEIEQRLLRVKHRQVLLAWLAERERSSKIELYR